MLPAVEAPRGFSEASSVLADVGTLALFHSFAFGGGYEVAVLLQDLNDVEAVDGFQELLS